MRARNPSGRRAAALLAGALLVVGCADESSPTAEPSTDTASPSRSTSSPVDPSTTASRSTAPPDVRAGRVVAISIDGLRAAALGAGTTPHLTRLLADGVGTRNARTAVEQTETLPNHACMVTGRRIAGPRGHGVTWNDDTDQSVRPGVRSVFDVVARDGGTSAVVAGKAKLDLLQDSWPDAVASFRLEPDMAAGADAVVTELAKRDLVFWHLRGPDTAGHGDGWGSAAYDAAVRSADAAVGRVLDAVAGDPDLDGDVAVVLTSDHGGVAGRRSHGDAPDHPGNFTVPFVVHGPGLAPGDLYQRNPGRADPGRARTPYDAPGGGPVRNCDLANVVTGLLGLRAVPGSEFGAGEGLRLAE